MGRFEDPRDRLEAAGAGHLEVEQDDVDADLCKGLDGVLAGAGDRGDLKPAVGFQHARQYRPRDHGIVDDHQSDPPAIRPMGLLAVPRFCERPLHRASPQATPTS